MGTLQLDEKSGYPRGQHENNWTDPEAVAMNRRRGNRIMKGGIPWLKQSA
jgi:hypothetical protein